MSSCDKPITECVQPANFRRGHWKSSNDEKPVTFNKWLNLSKQRKKKWPPTPLDILNGSSLQNTNLYNLLGWFIYPISPFSKDRFVKLSKVKSIKVMKICDDIMTLILPL